MSEQSDDQKPDIRTLIDSVLRLAGATERLAKNQITIVHNIYALWGVIFVIVLPALAVALVAALK